MRSYRRVVTAQLRMILKQQATYMYIYASLLSEYVLQQLATSRLYSGLDSANSDRKITNNNEQTTPFTLILHMEHSSRYITTELLELDTMRVPETARIHDSAHTAEPRPKSHTPDELKLCNFLATFVQGFFSPARELTNLSSSSTLRLSVQMMGAIIICARHCEMLQQSGEGTRILPNFAQKMYYSI